MEFKGTKGEWLVEQESGYDCDVVCDGVDICWLGLSDVSGEEQQANAKLIAAAPWLLKALQVFVDFRKEDLEGWIDEGTPVTMTVQSEDLYKALNAINKALN
jgi:hypothetical protein